MKSISTFVLALALGASLLVTSLLSSSAHAQSTTNNDFSVYLGYMLPNQIERVTEILPVFGGRYAYALPFGAIEGEIGNSHASGVDFTTLAMNLRGEAIVAPGLSGLFYVGPVISSYRPENAQNRQPEFGVQAGVGAVVLVKDALSARGDLKFMGGPGTSLYLLFGLMFRTPGT